MTALMAATALWLAVSMPEVSDSSTSNWADGPAALVERIAEWRPQGPPPWGEADHATSEEIEPAETRSAVGADRTRRSSGDIRTRAQR
jgi:hypothetical protein